jgi:hypothetical protein
MVWVDANQDGVKQDIEPALEGVTITLTGIDDLGNNVVLVTTTDVNGFYSFNNLRAGTYTILETQPIIGALIDGADYVGTIDGVTNGSLDNDRLFNIALGTNQQGINYNFTELFTE